MSNAPAKTLSASKVGKTVRPHDWSGFVPRTTTRNSYRGMFKVSPERVEPDEVHEIVRRHQRWAVLTVGPLAGLLIFLTLIDVTKELFDIEVRQLLIGGFLLALFYLLVLFPRVEHYGKKESIKTLTAKRKELYEALTPERYIIAGSALTILFVVAVLFGLLVLEEATTLLVGIAFVTPLGVVLNKWGELGEYYDKS